MQPSRRPCLCASLALPVLLLLAPRTRAETLTVTSTPPGAKIEIDGSPAGTTPYETKYPGGYFHKTHTVFGSRLDHSIVIRISKDGYLTKQVTITEGPFEWVAVNGRHHGKYFLLKSRHFDFKLEPISDGDGSPVETIDGEGPMLPPSAAALQGEDRDVPAETGKIEVASDPPGAEIYVDGKFTGQTPSTISLRAGSHRVELRASGKKSWVRDLEVFKDSRLTLHPVLESSP